MDAADLDTSLLDRIWDRVRSRLPPAPPPRTSGRPRRDDRACLDGIVYFFHTGCTWRDLPSRFPAGATCWRRHAEWVEAGVRETVWADVQDELAAAGLSGARQFASSVPVWSAAGVPVSTDSLRYEEQELLDLRRRAEERRDVATFDRLTEELNRVRPAYASRGW